MTTRLVTRHPEMRYRIFLSTLKGIGYLFSFYKGKVEVICPCCIMNSHRTKIASAVAKEIANGNIKAGEKVRWASVAGSEHGDAVGKNGGGILKTKSFCAILPEDIPAKAKEEAKSV